MAPSVTDMYNKNEEWRVFDEKEYSSDFDEYRTVYRHDYARLIHCPSFRRLQGKTQLFPASETDFFRNRLTHSMEVAQIAKSIALKINHECSVNINTDLVEFAALAHDLGHPPFGHQGEAALDECMFDSGGYEGNAQTLRILCKIEKKNDRGFLDEHQKDLRVGLNLTARTLASILKYNQVIPFRKESREEYQKNNHQSIAKPVKGIYRHEEDFVLEIKKRVLNGKDFDLKKFKTIECQIMDIADDISNATYDLEDVLKAGFFTPFDFLYASNELVDKILNKVANDEEIKAGLSEANEILTQDYIRSIMKNVFGEINRIIKDKIEGNSESKSDDNKNKSAETADLVMKLSYLASKEIVENGYNRVAVTSNLVRDFISGIEFKLNSEIPAMSKVKLKLWTRIQVETLKRFTYEVQILSTKLKVAEFRGKDIVKKVFKALSEDSGYELLPKDYRKLYDEARDDRKRIICDFIAGMTDKYLIEFYGRLFSENPETIFKPI